MTRRIAVVTGARADYGHLRNLVGAISGTPGLSLQMIVCGMHLDPKFGNTIAEIEADGVDIDALVTMDLSEDTSVGIARAVAQGVAGAAEAFERLRPDIVVVLGDRYEILAASQAAMLSRIPIAHLHGGEATEGLIDEAIRHSVTKMAHFHFVAAEPYRRRVIQLGEVPERVFWVGAPGLDNIVDDLPGRPDIYRATGIAPEEPYFVVTYHPVTLAADARTGVDEMLAALDRFSEAKILFTGVNADPGGQSVGRAITSYVAERPGRAVMRASLGCRLYLGSIKHATAVIGNSSSGLIEAPALAVPTVNIGERQRGRVRGDSVIDCPEERTAIAGAIRRACDAGFRASLDPARNPYGLPGASKKILDVLRTVSLDGVIMKRFHDLEKLS